MFSCLVLDQLASTPRQSSQVLNRLVVTTTETDASSFTCERAGMPMLYCNVLREAENEGCPDGQSRVPNQRRCRH